MVGIGTVINVIAVLIGGTVGLSLQGRLTEDLRETVMKGLGLITLVIGFRMALETQNVFVPMGSIVIGGLIGEWGMLKNKLDRFGEYLKAKSSLLLDGSSGYSTFSKGFVTASLVFCVGPMTILGAIQDGLTGNFKLLAVKSGLDAFAAMAFAATLGIGVLFSVITLIVYQGGLTLLAASLAGQMAGMDVANSMAVNELSATGGILIIGIGLMLLEIKDIKVTNYLPSIVIAPAVVALLAFFGVSI